MRTPRPRSTRRPADGSIWGAVTYVPGLLVRYEPTTGLSEVYEPPFGDEAAEVQGLAPRGVDVDSSGLVWTGLQSGHLASFDRRKCQTLNGPTATGRHCPEGWTLHRTPGPSLKGVTDQGSTDFHYYNFVDRFDTFGLGLDTPFVNGTNSELSCRADNSSCCASRTRSATLAGDSTGGSTTLTAAGKEEGSGRRIVARSLAHGRRQGHDQQADACAVADWPAGALARGCQSSKTERSSSRYTGCTR